MDSAMSSGVLPPPPPPKKLLRKGTRSCLECRRRKIKCTYETGSGGAPCDGCVSRQMRCETQDQTNLDRVREPTRERVDRLEVVVENLSRTVVELQEWKACALGTVEGTPVSLPEAGRAEWSMESGYQDDGDAMSTATTPLTAAVEDLEKPLSREDRRLRGLRETLIALVPSRDDALTITASAVDWWNIHRTLLPLPPIKSRIELIELHQELAKPETQLTAIATWMCCLAMTFRQLPPSFHYSVLESIVDPVDYASEVGNTVEALLAEDSIMGTCEGLDCAVIYAQLQKSIGRPKKGWIVLRRAIAFAELLKLPTAKVTLKHLKGGQANNEHVASLEARAGLWESICATDRLLCLLLGLPNVSASLHSGPTIDPNDPHSRTRRLAWVQSDVANYIAYRDHLEDEEEAFAKTNRIAEKLRAIQQTWPAEWSAVEHWTEYDAKTASCVLLQTSHSYLVLRLHLPYLVKAREDTRYAPNASECLQACRETLRRYFAVRTRFAIGGFMSRSFDILAFTASVILLVHCRGGQDLHLSSTDTAIIENARTAMRHTTDRASEALTEKMLLSLHSIQQCLDGYAGSPACVKLQVPMLGEVVVRRTEHGQAGIERASDAIADVSFDFDALDDDWYLQDAVKRH